MKIERINENQVKVFLNQNDLKERNIQLTELACGSEKTQALFIELLEQALKDIEFEIENVPLMVEATMYKDDVILIVTKVKENTDINRNFSLMPASKEYRKFKGNDININFPKSEADDEFESDEILIYSFASLDDICDFSYRVNPIFSGSNSLYKYQNEFFIVAQNDSGNDVNFDNLEMIFSEYGTKRVSNIVSKYFLDEHAEIIIKEDAIKTFASYM